MPPTRVRLSAEERREEVLRAALVEFAEGGLHATSTEAIARRAGISQPYLFRLFPTKTDLFIAVVDRCFERVIDAFGAAMANAEPEEKLYAMGDTYIGLLDDRAKLLSQVQAWAACDDPQIRKAVQRGWENLYTFVKSESGASTDEVTPA